MPNLLRRSRTWPQLESSCSDVSCLRDRHQSLLASAGGSASTLLLRGYRRFGLPGSRWARRGLHPAGPTPIRAPAACRPTRSAAAWRRAESRSRYVAAQDCAGHMVGGGTPQRETCRKLVCYRSRHGLSAASPRPGQSERCRVQKSLKHVTGDARNIVVVAGVGQRRPPSDRTC